VIVALQRTGRGADADTLLAAYRAYLNRLPKVGLLGDEKALGSAQLAALSGDREAAIRKLDELTRRVPVLLLPIPAMALRYNPVFSSLSNDPRFAAIEDRMRQAINRERQKAGLAPISREAWISDPKTLLTKN
jgi:hypothetical protein